MAETSKIAWAHATFNPWEGCAKVHTGCANCYAEARAERWNTVKWGPSGTRRRAADSYWKQPLKWDREAKDAGERRRVFCASLADVFEDWQGPIVDSKGHKLWTPRHGYVWDTPLPVSPQGDYSGRRPLTMTDLRESLFHLIDQTPNLDWLLVTKRPENIRKMWMPRERVDGEAVFPGDRYRRNVWLLTSISDQPTANAMIPPLLACRDLAPVLGVSAEPLLGLIGLCDCRSNITPVGWHTQECRLKQLNWLIIGCESDGPRVGRLGTECETEWWAWALDLTRQCQAADVATFVKQVPMSGMVAHDPEAWREDMRLRQYPGEVGPRGA